MSKIITLYKKISWKQGSGTILFYISMMWLLVIAFILLLELYNAFSGGGTSQLLADLTADGAAFIGNTGWGLDEDLAQEAKDVLEKMNTDEDLTGTMFEDVRVKIDFSNKDDEGFGIYGKNTNNTVDATAIWDSSLLTNSYFEIYSENTASTRIAYTGGLKVVYQAWIHTYQKIGSDVGQTWYAWGGGHGNDTSWEQYADCSGFVTGVFRACGYDVPNWMCTQDLEKMGDLVGVGYSALEDAQPGDIILYWWEDASGTSSHVAIYAGKYNGRYYQIHSSGNKNYSYSNPGKGSDGRGAVLSTVSTSAVKIMIRRIVGTDAEAYEATRESIPGMNENATTIYFGLSELGYSDIAISAIMGNLWHETGGNFDPTTIFSHSPSDTYTVAYTEKVQAGEISRMAFSKSGEAYGIAQWLDENRKGFLWDQSNSGDVTDIYVQIAFIDYELRTYTDSKFRALYTLLMTTDNLEEATREFFEIYEGANDSSFQARYAYAQQIYSYIQNYRNS